MNFRRLVKRVVGRRSRADDAAGKYTKLELDEAAIANEAYKDHLGGGSEAWQTRGRFQLDLLRSRGLNPKSTLLDIGCGPLRAGLHFIRFLAPNHYYGFDYNQSFIAAAQRVIEENDLSEKHPTVAALIDFDLSKIGRSFDYAIAFSVLNHCSATQRQLFFANISGCLKPGAKLIVSHARWLEETGLASYGLRISKVFSAAELELDRYGWPASEQRSVVPIYELEMATS
jgi:SAM-dependent methyltransferase